MNSPLVLEGKFTSGNFAAKDMTIGNAGFSSGYLLKANQLILLVSETGNILLIVLVLE